MQVIGWTSNYQETLKELGLEDGDVGFPEGPDRGCTVLVGKYIARIRTTLHAWFENILEACAFVPLPPVPCCLHPSERSPARIVQVRTCRKAQATAHALASGMHDMWRLVKAVVLSPGSAVVTWTRLSHPCLCCSCAGRHARGA